MSKRKIVIMILLLSMVLVTLTACGLSNYEGYLKLNDTINNLKCYSFDSTAVVVVTKDTFNSIASANGETNIQLQNDINFFVSMKGEIDKSKKIMSCNIGVKLAKEDEYIPTISFITDNKFVYINTKTLVNAIFELASPMLGNLTQRDVEIEVSKTIGSNEYIAFPLDDDKFNVWGESKNPTVIVSLEKRVADTLKKQLSKMEKSFGYDKKNNEYSFTLQKVDIQALANVLLVDVEENANWYVDAFITLANEENQKEAVKQLQNQRNTFIGSLKDSIPEIKKEIAKMEETTLLSKVAYEKKEGKFTTDVKLLYKNSNYIEITQTLVKKDSVSIGTPTNYFDGTEIYNKALASSVDSLGGNGEPTESTDNPVVTPEPEKDQPSNDNASSPVENPTPVATPTSATQQPANPSNYDFITMKEITVNNKKFDAAYINGDKWYYISNDGLYSTKGNISITTRLIPYENNKETAELLVQATLDTVQNRMKNNGKATYRILSADTYGKQDLAYGVIQYSMNDGFHNYVNCYNIYKKEISQDKTSIIETTFVYTPGYWAADKDETSTIKEIVEYMKVNVQ